MPIIIPTLIISFLLDGMISNLITLDTNYFNPLFSLVALIIIYPYFNKNNNHYLLIASVYGLIYDMVYTDTFALNLAIFLLLAVITKYMNSVLNINIINTLINLLVLIVLYRSLTYFILILGGYLEFDIMALFKSIYSSLIINFVYCLIGYYFLDYLSYRFRIKKWD